VSFFTTKNVPIRAKLLAKRERVSPAANTMGLGPSTLVTSDKLKIHIGSSLVLKRVKAVVLIQCCAMHRTCSVRRHRNISKPFAFLLKIGISNNSAQKILRNTAVQVNFQQLTAMCLHLNCTPNDLFALRDLTPPANHALHALKSVDEPTPDLASWIATKKLAEIASMIEGKEQGGGAAQPL